MNQTPALSSREKSTNFLKERDDFYSQEKIDNQTTTKTIKAIKYLKKSLDIKSESLTILLKNLGRI